MDVIRFYHNVRHREHGLCQILTKALAQGKTAAVLAGSMADLNALDQLMWEVPATGFIPHCQVGEPVEHDTPIVLGLDTQKLPSRDILVNWTDAAIADDPRFSMLVEMVAADDEVGKAQARERFRAYRQAGRLIEAHDMAVIRGGSDGTQG